MLLQSMCARLAYIHAFPQLFSSATLPLGRGMQRVERGGADIVCGMAMQQLST